MTEIIDINIKNRTEDEESGDAYYTAEVKILEPGAAFIEQEKSIAKTIKQKITLRG